MIKNREKKLEGCTTIFTNVKNKKFKKHFIKKGYKNRSIQNRYKVHVILIFNVFLKSMSMPFPDEIKTIIFRYSGLFYEDIHSFIDENLNFYDSNNQGRKFFGLLNSPPCLKKCKHGDTHHKNSEEHFCDVNNDNIIMYK